MNTKSLHIRGGLIAVMLALAAGTLSAAQPGHYDGSTWALLDEAKIIQAAADITPAKYPDCDEATVDKRMVRVYRADGTAEAQDETFVKVLTEKGKRNNRTLAMSFMLPYFTVEVAKLEIIRPNGNIVPVDVAANSKETIDDSQMAMNIYDPNSKVLQVNIPKLEIGDVVHSVVRQTTQRSIIPGEFAEYNVFEGSGYLRHTSYEVHSPKDKPLKRIELRDPVKGTVTYSKISEPGGGVIHRWEVNNVPRMFDEPAMPPYEEVLQRLLVSTTPDWRDVSKWYWKLSQPHLEAITPEMKATAAQLITGAKTDLDKVKAVFYYVSKQIRYMGLTPEKDRPGYEPHDVSLTFGKKYGVCRDKAALLVSLLRAAGLKSFPVLIDVGAKKDPDVPEPFFNHAIVSVELKKGEYVLMDPTDENTRELLPAGDRNQSYLVCRPEGETINISPIQPADENMMRVKTAATMNANGGLQAKSELSFEGVNDNSYRSAFVRMKQDDRRRFFERALKSSMPGARLNSLKLTPDNMLDVSQPVRAEIEFSVDGMTASGGGKSVVSVPWVGNGMGVLNFILGGTGLEKRKYPMQTYVACGLKEDVSIQLGNGFKGAVSMPSCSPVNDKCLSYHESFSFKPQALDCSRELKLKVVQFSPKEYAKLKQTLEQLEYDARKAPVLATSENARPKPLDLAAAPADPPVESNAKLLESDKELDIQDAHTATYKVRYAKRILTYEGKIREAEVKVDYNPSCEEAKLIRGVVTSKSGKRQEISKDEINVMDAGWNSSAKRYTGGKVLVANLPGVEIGSTIEVEFEITTKGKPFVSGFESFQMPDALVQKKFRLTAPEGLDIEKLVTGQPGIVKEHTGEENGRQVLDWTSQDVKALPAESQLPPEWVYMAGVGYFAGDALAYARDLNDAMVARSHEGARAAGLARQLTAKTKTRLEAATAIRDFVAKSIRLAGPSFTDLPLSELSTADTTLADGYGHLADRAILLHSMLSAAGFDPEFVLASSLPPISGITNVAMSFPLAGSFTMPLVRVTVDGQKYYLNDTDQYSRLGSTSYDGRLAASLSEPAWEIIHAAPDCQDKSDTEYKVSLSPAGKARIGITCHYYGDNYNSRNKFFSELPPEERRRYYQEIVSDVSQGARPVGDLITKFDCYPGVEEYTVDVDHYAVVDGKYLYFDLPFTPSMFASGADSRTLPLYISGQSDRTTRTEIQLPPGYGHVVIAPQSKKLNAPCGCGQARITAQDSGGKFIITHQFETDPAIVPAADYAAFQNVQTTLGRKSSRAFLLEKD